MPLPYPTFLAGTAVELYARQALVRLAQKLIGVPYRWGGDNPRGGFDCSGFVIWLLQVFGFLPAGDWTADALKARFVATDSPKPGDLAFYGREKAGHVVMYIGDLNGEPQAIGANGGDKTTTNDERAKEQNAFVKMKPVHYRRDFMGYVNITKEMPQ